jgi:hypothetical protein
MRGARCESLRLVFDRTMPTSVVLLGHSQRTEFGPVHAALANAGLQATRLAHSSTFPDTRPAADLWIVCQSWPDEFSPAAVRRIVGDCAAARLVCVYGAWCASEGRSRTSWPPAVRVPVSEFTARLRFELGVIDGRVAPLPITAARDECFSVRVQSP